MTLNHTAFGLALIAAFGCASGTQRLGKIDPGMSPIQVDSVMGRRDSFSSVQHEGSTFLMYQYVNRLCNANSSFDRCDFYVIFRDSVVAETGVKNVRESKPDMKFFYLFVQ